MKLRTVTPLFLTLAVLAFFPSPLPAKNLDGRIGFGMTYHDFNSSSSLSLRYHFSQHVNTTFVVGFDTSENKNSTVLGFKLTRHAHLEENMNFYVGMGGYIIADKSTDANVSSGMEFDGFLGGEFFLSGLPNLGFLFESGISVRTIRKISASTAGGAFAGAGIHYYF